MTTKKTNIYKHTELILTPIITPDYTYWNSQMPWERTMIRSRWPAMFYIGEFTTALLPTNNVKAWYVARDTTASKIKVYGTDNAWHG